MYVCMYIYLTCVDMLASVSYVCFYVCLRIVCLTEQLSLLFCYPVCLHASTDV